MLPPELLRHYKDGKFENKIVEWPAGQYRWESDFQEATLGNKGKYELNDQGTIIDKSTGKQPTYVYGFPFPDIDPKDPKAAAKILWNSYYGYWYQGNSRNEVRLVWAIPTASIARRARTSSSCTTTASRRAVPRRQPEEPARCSSSRPRPSRPTCRARRRSRGATATPTQRDSNWAYVPSLRRVRAVSPTNRSDGFLGSDMSQDDGPFFDGKPEDFDWKLLESKDQLPPGRSARASRRARPSTRWLPGGGWRTLIDPDTPAVGFQQPGVEGPRLGARRHPALAKRPVWVIEATPKDKYYLYGKVQLYVDKETYQGVYNRKFNWRDELMNTYLIVGYMSRSASAPTAARTGSGRRTWSTRRPRTSR